MHEGPFLWKVHVNEGGYKNVVMYLHADIISGLYYIKVLTCVSTRTWFNNYGMKGLVVSDDVISVIIYV